MRALRRQKGSLHPKTRRQLRGLQIQMPHLPELQEGHLPGEKDLQENLRREVKDEEVNASSRQVEIFDEFSLLEVSR